MQLSIVAHFRGMKTFRSGLRWTLCLVPELTFLFAASVGICIPKPLFSDPYATVLLDRDGQMLSSRIAADGQWRFPAREKVPYRFRECLIEFEDRTFYEHPGISARGLGRALSQNLRHGEIQSGGSTLTMQLARLSRKNKQRSFWNKGMECLWALHLECRYTKSELLAMYSAHAPFGGNVVGLEAAAWRYFGRPAANLSWAEAASLAILPNAPGLIFPGRNEDRFRAKRNRLLVRLKERGIIKPDELQLALGEPLPGKPVPQPHRATQLLDHAVKLGMAHRFIESTIDRNRQDMVLQVLGRYHEQYRGQEIHNMAAMVVDLHTNEVLAYVGNTSDLSTGGSEAPVVNCLTAPRSSGSILKPLLYGYALDRGEISPNSLLSDVPTHLSGFAPRNFDQRYDGVVPAHEALARSLNVPFVHLLARHGVPRFHQELRGLGFKTLFRNPSGYGLTLVLGGAEVRLWDIAQAYGSCARTLLKSQNRIAKGSRALHFAVDSSIWGNEPDPGMEAGSIYAMLEAMVEPGRPGAESNWRYLGNGNKVAWKTGTSYGFRDAWSVGMTSRYLVAVWVGNADGEGRPGLTGIQSAAPILFEILGRMPAEPWFPTPFSQMKSLVLCHESGQRMGPHCVHPDTILLPRTCAQLAACRFHRDLILDESAKFRVHADCYNPSKVVHQTAFVLPPAEASYYRLRSPHYQNLPPWMPGCAPVDGTTSAIQIVYPRAESKIMSPRTFSGDQNELVFQASHRDAGMALYWQLDGNYIGKTLDFHQLQALPDTGWHELTVTDAEGREARVQFVVR